MSMLAAETVRMSHGSCTRGAFGCMDTDNNAHHQVLVTHPDIAIGARRFGDSEELSDTNTNTGVVRLSSPQIQISCSVCVCAFWLTHEPPQILCHCFLFFFLSLVSCCLTCLFLLSPSSYGPGTGEGDCLSLGRCPTGTVRPASKALQAVLAHTPSGVPSRISFFVWILFLKSREIMEKEPKDPNSHSHSLKSKTFGV